MKKQADKEMVAIRRITEILQDLEPGARQRVLAYVAARAADMPNPLMLAGPPPTRLAAPSLPFPDADAVKASPIMGGGNV